VNLGSFAEFFVLTVLKSHGLSAADIRLVDTDAAELPAKLKSGEVDAGHTWEPFVTQAKDEGARVLFTSAATPGLIQDVVAVRGEVLGEREGAQCLRQRLVQGRRLLEGPSGSGQHPRGKSAKRRSEYDLPRRHSLDDPAGQYPAL